MTYLLDTCIISKLRRLKTHPDPVLANWIGKHPESAYFVSVLTLGEIQAGITKLDGMHKDQNRQRMQLEDWLFGELVPRFQNRVLEITLPIAFTWGKLSSHGLQNSKIVPVADGLIAATAIHHGLIVVTENSKHFSFQGVELINPWAISSKTR